MNGTKTQITEDVLVGIDRALSFFESKLVEQQGTTSIDTLPGITDMVRELRAAQSWVMGVQSQIARSEQ